jgi:GNAT superfamily N-acetyltransferase
VHGDFMSPHELPISYEGPIACGALSRFHAYAGGRLVGLLEVLPAQDALSEYPQLTIFVLPAWRRRGIATALLNLYRAHHKCSVDGERGGAMLEFRLS